MAILRFLASLTHDSRAAITAVGNRPYSVSEGRKSRLKPAFLAVRPKGYPIIATSTLPPIGAAIDSPTPPFWIKTTSLGLIPAASSIDNLAKSLDAPKRATPTLFTLTSLIELISGLAQPSMVRTGNGDAIAIRSLPA